MKTPLYMLLDGIDSRDLGIYVVDPLPPVVIPGRREESIQIPGMSGMLTYSNGDFDEYAKTIRLYFDGVDLQAAIDYLDNPATLTLSDEPDKLYLCRRSGASELKRARRRRYIFDYALAVNPLKRQAAPEAIDIGSGIILVNNTNEPAYPSFDATGSGDLVVTVGTQTFTVSDVVESLTVEGADIFSAYDSGGSANNRMVGEFPVMDPGEEYSVSFAGITAVSIRPNWRWH